MSLSGGLKQYEVPLWLYKNYIIYALIGIGIEGPELEKCWFWGSVTMLVKAIYTDL